MAAGCGRLSQAPEKPTGRIIGRRAKGSSAERPGHDAVHRAPLCSDERNPGTPAPGLV
ncbi:hypothetical protein SF06_13220 [Pseudomonas flexibilis]|nr:hypothetical protein SF06_13220 [Pseudomonas flexibilis]